MTILQPIERVRGVLQVKRSRARRSLVFTADKSPKTALNNVKYADTLATISAQEFASKWSFDVNKGVPIPGGPFNWTLKDPKASPDLTPSDLTSGNTVRGQNMVQSEGDLSCAVKNDVSKAHGPCCRTLTDPKASSDLSSTDLTSGMDVRGQSGAESERDPSCGEAGCVPSQSEVRDGQKEVQGSHTEVRG